jgi:hypothetical protein
MIYDDSPTYPRSGRAPLRLGHLSYRHVQFQADPDVDQGVSVRALKPISKRSYRVFQSGGLIPSGVKLRPQQREEPPKKGSWANLVLARRIRIRPIVGSCSGLNSSPPRQPRFACIDSDASGSYSIQEFRTVLASACYGIFLRILYSNGDANPADRQQRNPVPQTVRASYCSR